MTIRQQTAFNFFVSKGYLPSGAAAIVGNLSQESGNNLDSKFRLQTDHGSQGIAQWRLDRLTRLEKFAVDSQMDVTDLTTQMFYLIDELSKIYPALNSMLKAGGRSVANLTANFMAVFERPSAQFAGLDNRIKQASLVLAASEASKPPVSPPEVIPAGAVVLGGGGAAAYSWHLGLNGILTVSLITLTAAAVLVFLFYLSRRLTSPYAVNAPVTAPHPAAELHQAIGDFKDASSRLDAAEAVLLADRQTTEDLLAQVKAIKGTAK